MSTDDLDFTQPAQNAIYDPAVARAFFESAGAAQSVSQGESLFMQDQKGDKVYFLLEGEVSLMRGRKMIDIVKAGEIIGEMAMVSQQPRTATALARMPCRVIALDARHFQVAFQRMPEFALMLMSTTINRIRLTVATLSIGNTLSGQDRWRECCVFDRASLSALLSELGDRTPLYAPRRKTIMSEGEAGVFMYVVLEGTVAISIKGKAVEKVGEGGVFGEMALVDKSPRTATAVAESDCSLLTINRTDFLALVKTRPDFAMSILRALADRLRFLTSRYG